jgi:hypothetical protein
MFNFNSKGDEQAAAVWFRIAEVIDAIQLKKIAVDKRIHLVLTSSVTILIPKIYGCDR